MELSKLQTVDAHETGAECQILSPVDGSLTDVFIMLKGIDSKDWRNQKKKQTSKLLSARASGKLDDLDFDALDIEALVECTIGWRGLQDEKKPYPFTKANAIDLYSQSPYVVNQLLEFIGKRVNFTKG
tara:strand:- start:943 stop:1326 length:384 start_codon:yes stop_codon:yes gene_type:complete